MTDPMYGPNPAFFGNQPAPSPAMPPHTISANVHDSDDIPYSSMFPSAAPTGFDAAAAISHPPASSRAAVPLPHQEEYILYYFERVRKLQYMLSGDSLTNILYSVSTIAAA